ncbi:3-oxo-tetronate kinase [Jhaorihella thermophila]|uniref:3-oxo-tetronate kinase n=1 Tax=Jhaorihella thermophila TaxID=488547 RepID=A0A1H5RRB4_9RHOB|nr:3-oxo-tetronate kinase [Jhaorihella thermophila]SEF40684.1 Uncharacterized conserved protein YgbK, DUF1537 family [Jhaorihella thermophila]
MAVLLGAIADDFTGATDLANTLVNQGMRAVQVIGVPDAGTDVGDAQAVVVALKSRTAPVAQAVEQSLAALRWLRGQGARQIVQKYCSTFDSRATGNIGPVADALAEALGADFAIVCPAFPANGRTVYQGHLFVGADLLSDSPMKDHPLTPMRDASLIRLLQAQTPHKVGLIPWQVVRQGAGAIRARVDALRAEGVRYGVADALDEDDLRRIGRAAADHALVTGGSGVAMGLPDNFRSKGLLGATGSPAMPRVAGRAVVLAGSCSAATRAQIAAAPAGWPRRRIDVNLIAEDRDVAGDLADWAAAQPTDRPVLIHASAAPDEVAETQAKYGVDRAGAMVEGVMGALAVRLRDAGFARMVVAGGETSGAVVSALGVRAMRIGPEIAPGVPWTESLGRPPLALALKSGNFGGRDFLAKAFEVLG